jgi:hypothetical protein
LATVGILKRVTSIQTVLQLIIRTVQIMLTVWFNAFLFDFNGFIPKNKVKIKKLIILLRSQIDLHIDGCKVISPISTFFFTFTQTFTNLYLQLCPVKWHFIQNLCKFWLISTLNTVSAQCLLN